MRKTTFFVVLGESRSGKDFLANLVGLPVVKFAAPQKRKLELLYGLPLGALEQRDIKDTVASEGKTFLEMLLEEYHRQQEKYTSLGWQAFYRDRRQTNVKDILFYIQNGLDIMFTDCRNTYEAELICHLAEANWCDIAIHSLFRKGSKSLDSDKSIDDIYQVLDRSNRCKSIWVSYDASAENLIKMYNDYRLAT